jgi:hypothetical protein
MDDIDTVFHYSGDETRTSNAITMHEEMDWKIVSSEDHLPPRRSLEKMSE